MGRRLGSNCKESDRGRVGCTVCRRSLPQSAFSKRELSRSGDGRCRDCLGWQKCKQCGLQQRVTELNDAGRCRKCCENSQVDRLLQTPKDEITHFGAWRALCLQREFEHSVLLLCQQHGVWERLVLQKVLDFLRVPFVTSHGGVQYCELCDEAFGEIAIGQGQTVRMSQPSKLADWCGCPGPALKFNQGERHAVTELQKTASGSWFFRTLAKARTKRAPAAWRELPLRDVAEDLQEDLRDDVLGFLEDHSLSTAGDLAAVSHQYIQQALAEAGGSLGPEEHRAVLRLVAGARELAEAVPARVVPEEFVSLWAPLSATVEGKRPSPLVEHLQSSQHKGHEEALSSGRLALVSRAALELAKGLGEQPTASLDRFRAGLGVAGRFCEPADVERARRLRRVRDSGFPVKFFREALPGRRDMVWVTPEELADVEEQYGQKKGDRRSRRSRDAQAPGRIGQPPAGAVRASAA